METLWLIVHDASYQWAVVNDHGKTINQGQSSLDSLSALEASRQYPARILLGAEYLYTRQVTPPKKMSMHKAEQVIPYMIEDDILHPIEHLYCKPLARLNGQLDIAISDQDHMAAVSQILHETKLNIKGVYPLAYALPNAWYLYQDESLSYVRTPAHSFVAPHESAWQLLTMIYQQAEIPPSAIPMSYSPNVEPQIFDTQIPIQDQGAQPIWQVLATTLPTTPMLNPEFIVAPKKGLSQTLMILNIVILVLIVTGLNLGFKVNKLLYLQDTHENIQADMTAIYEELYPNATSVVAPKLRMQQEIDKLGQGGNDTFFGLMSPLAKTIQQNRQLDIQDIQFVNETLMVRLKAGEYQSIDKAIQLLSRDLTVQQKETTTEGDSFSAVLALTRKGT